MHTYAECCCVAMWLMHWQFFFLDSDLHLIHFLIVPTFSHRNFFSGLHTKELIRDFFPPLFVAWYQNRKVTNSQMTMATRNCSCYLCIMSCWPPFSSILPFYSIFLVFRSVGSSPSFLPMLWYLNNVIWFVWPAFAAIDFFLPRIEFGKEYKRKTATTHPSSIHDQFLLLFPKCLFLSFFILRLNNSAFLDRHSPMKNNMKARLAFQAAWKCSKLLV